MPARRPLSRYPSAYSLLIEAIYDEGKGVRVYTDSVGKAKTVRSELYNFRYALRDSVAIGAADEETLRVQRKAEAVRLRVEKNPPSLILEPVGPHALEAIKA